MIPKVRPILGATLIFILILAMACGGDATATPSPTQSPGATATPEPTQSPTATPSSTPEPPPPAASTDYSGIITELSRLVQGVVDESGITGLSVALVDDQEMVWAEGFGFADKENGVKATPETVYGVASVSKLFTATAIMQLAENGEIDIDLPLQTYIPEFSINSRFTGSDPITLRNIMTHHAGLPSDLLNGMAVLGDNEISLTESAFDDLVQQLKTSYVAHPPNTGFSYSNLGYGLLGHAVAQSSGQDFIEYLGEAVLQPLGMNNSSFTITPEIERLRSKEYRNGEEVTHTWFRDLPAGALSTNVQDLSRFMMMVFGDGEVDGQRILKTETLAEMMRPQNTDVPLDLDTQWGLSWWLLPLGLEYAGKNAWHGGGEGMWNSILYTLPDHKLGVVVLGNSAEASQTVDQIAATVLEKALEVKTGLKKPVVEAPEVISVSSGELQNFTGRYATSMGRMDIRLDGDDLYADLFGQSFKLAPHSDGRFSVEGLSWSDAHFTIRTVDGRSVLRLFGSAVSLGFGERVEPSPVSEAWLGRLGAYEISDRLPGFTDLFTSFQLRYEDDFLLLDARCAIECDQIIMTVGTLSDDEAVTLGIGTRRGESLRFVDVDGEEQLSFGGYLFRKLTAAELLQAVLEEDVASSDTSYPGAVLHVSGPEFGTWTGVAGLGNVETNTAMRTNNKFRAGSLTKPMISVIILQLVEEGLFSLDDPLPAVLPERITSKVANSEQITVRMLLNHTGGLPEFLDLAIGEIFADTEKVWQEEEFLDFAATLEPLFSPGEFISYSNTDYTVLGMVIEEATGQSWRQEMRERIFEPLNLEGTLLPEPDDTTIPGNHARGYSDFGSGVIDATELVNASVVGAPGGQSMVTTPEDLARFWDSVLAGELFQESGTLDVMLHLPDIAFIENPDEDLFLGYGLGVMHIDFGNGITGIGHTGDTEGGYHVFMFHFEEQDLTISGAVNSPDWKAGFRLIPQALEILVPGYTAPSPEQASTPPITDADGNVIPGSIAAIETVTVGGIEQSILIRGADVTKPVLLWLHGGPGLPFSPFVGMFQPSELEENFVVVHWDQRGAGKSYYPSLTADDMRPEKFVSDTLELTDILRDFFDQEKIFLFGISWGSALGFMTIMENSDPYHAFIAASEAGDRNRRWMMSYEWVLEQAREASNGEVVEALEALQPFDSTNPEHTGAVGQVLDLFRAGNLYTEGLWGAAVGYLTSGESPEYTATDVEKLFAGVGLSGQTTEIDIHKSDYNLFRDFPVSPIPVHFFAGRHDYVTPGELAEEYYNFLDAPAKSFTWFEDSAHIMAWDEPDKTAQELIRIANEILNP